LTQITQLIFCIVNFAALMKQICVTILLFCTLLATFSKGLLVLCFDINEQYIAQELCVNKAKPDLHCNGHCYLSKQLDKEEKPGSPLSNSSKEKFEIQLFVVSVAQIHFAKAINKTSFSTGISHFHTQEVLLNCFRPPQV